MWDLGFLSREGPRVMAQLPANSPDNVFIVCVFFLFFLFFFCSSTDFIVYRGDLIFYHWFIF